MNSRRNFLTTGGGTALGILALAGGIPFAQRSSFSMTPIRGNKMRCKINDVTRFHQEIGNFADQGTPIHAKGNLLTLTRGGQKLQIQLIVNDRSLLS